MLYFEFKFISNPIIRDFYVKIFFAKRNVDFELKEIRKLYTLFFIVYKGINGFWCLFSCNLLNTLLVLILESNS
ncbi:hypothetical protein CWI39_0083p0020 [Hamiltosporidium magnivora]|uniref:Uncharacterized protein n=1 Tax=Hamiltosporidium magnivora TaxID=148818 RepID=A0A4Q9LLW5_9MICR|nr:hypothetical protein CWI39_0083p0020 [Hamiltosporidium magnivora]